MEMKSPRSNKIWSIGNSLVSETGHIYQLECELGEGGNSVVFSGVETSSGNEYAVKIHLVQGVAGEKRFVQEIKLLREHSHNYLVRFVDSGNIEATLKVKAGEKAEKVSFPFVVMDKADSDLLKFLKSHDWHVDYEIYAPQFRGLASALAELHKTAIHRDIKPENILVKGETWLLSDLGLSVLTDEAERIDVTQNNEVVGPRLWPSPESLNQSYKGSSNDIDTASDVYQLCAVFWLVLTGKHPLGQIREADFIPNDKTRSLFEKIVDALSYNKANRPVNGEELGRMLNEATIERGLSL